MENCSKCVELSEYKDIQGVHIKAQAGLINELENAIKKWKEDYNLLLDDYNELGEQAGSLVKALDKIESELPRCYKPNVCNAQSIAKQALENLEKNKRLADVK